MNDTNSNLEDELEYSFSLEIATPDALNIAKSVLEHVQDSNEGINRAKFEIESSEPIKTDFIFQSQDVDSQKHETEVKSVKGLISPQSNTFKIASVLLNEDTPMIVDEILECIEDTKWSTTRKSVSNALIDLRKKDMIIRNKRKIDSMGSNPYQYSLTEQSKVQLKSIEEQINEDGGDTYEVIKEEDTIQDVHECDICGEKFKNASGLGSHRYYKHGEDEDEDTADSTTEQTEIESEDKQPKNISISPDTGRFYALSMIYNSSKPVTPKDIEARFENTEWETDRSSFSSVLGKLESEGFVRRDKRHSERGSPYEYQLTEHGKSKIKSAITQAQKTDRKTFEDVIEGK